MLLDTALRPADVADVAPSVPAAHLFMKTIVMSPPSEAAAADEVVEPAELVMRIEPAPAANVHANFHIHPRLVVAVVLAGVLLTTLLLTAAILLAPQGFALGV